MSEFLNSIDTSLFYFINVTLSNPITDKVMPFITENNHWLLVYIVLLGYLFFKGGRRGKVAVISVLILIALADQSTNLLKEYFARLRPCKTLDGINLLVGCNSPFGMPSNHAVNNFAAATLFSYFYPNYKITLFVAASLVAISRVFVGVHYPFDILAGALTGFVEAIVIIYLFKFVNSKFKILD
ncbi:MAG TPA: phosphatase PAP2 family protein [Ignavibacteria bacterium]|nr:phosphatase PAP2 family protein [Ignavibacteria bacterium]